MQASACAPSDHECADILKQQHEAISQIPQLAQTLEAIPIISLVINAKRQIVFANQAFHALLKERDRSEDGMPFFSGKKPGEALECIHAFKADEGCGGSVSCQACGVMDAILTSQKGIPEVQECRMMRRGSSGQTEAMDFRVTAHPLPLQDHELTLVTLADISNEKRRHVLERTFFHDILNTATGIQGLAQMLAELAGRDESVQNIASLLCFSSEQLIEEINAQRMLHAAERSELVAEPKPVDVLAMLQKLTECYTHHDVARNRFFRIADQAQHVNIQSDDVLLRRVVLNLLKNALEATPKGGTVTLNVSQSSDMAYISVHNVLVMPNIVKLQVFNRSFSTRGAGRGLGTYGVKLLTENYLGGQVSFQSEEGKGTIFMVALPVEWKSVERRNP